MEENKTAIIESLTKTLQKTYYFHDLLFLEYRKNEEEGSEVVVAHFENGNERVVNVHLDSGITMINDVLEVLCDGD